MEPLPRGANFQRAKLLWEIGLHIAGDPNTPYYGPRDMCISVGSGSADKFRPWLRMSTGSPILAQAVCRGDLEMSMVNPSGFLTQAYRGTGLFPQPLPVRVLATYPSWDRYVHLIHERTGLKSLADIKSKKYPLRLSIREDATHSTRVLLDQTLALYGFTLADLESWGGSLQLNGGPGDQRRMEALSGGTIDAIFDEGLVLWFDKALAGGMQPLALDEFAFKQLEALGWHTGHEGGAGQALEREVDVGIAGAGLQRDAARAEERDPVHRRAGSANLNGAVHGHAQDEARLRRQLE